MRKFLPPTLVLIKESFSFTVPENQPIRSLPASITFGACIQCMFITPSYLTSSLGRSRLTSMTKNERKQLSSPFDSTETAA